MVRIRARSSRTRRRTDRPLSALRHYAGPEYQIGRPVAEREQTALRAVDVARATGDANEIARALATLGACYRSAARFDEAERRLYRGV